MTIKTFKLADGELRQKPDGVLFVGSNGSRILFEGVKVHVGTFFIPRDTAFQIAGHVFISRHWLSGGFSLVSFSHEYGHFLQQRALGSLRYVFGIALPSVWSMLTNPILHPTRRFERHATLLGKRYVANNMIPYRA